MATKLMFRIGVKDDASGPVGKLQKALRSTSRMSKQAWGQLAGGAMTAAGAGLALEGMVSPALDLNRALADVSSLDVDAKGLKLLDATAKQYAMSYGGTAAEFVASSYAIQSRGWTPRSLRTLPAPQTCWPRPRKRTRPP